MAHLMLVHTAKESKSHTCGTAAIKALADFGFAAANVEVVKRLTITAGANALRVTWSGTNPTTTLGHYVAANANLVIDGNINCKQLKIQALTGDSVVTATIEI